MADQNSLNKPDGTSNYSTEVWQTMRAHVLRLWKGDYTGMGDLVAGLRRWVRVGTTDVKLVERAADGSETTIFDSSNKADALGVTAALAAKAPLAGRTNWVEKNVIPVVAGMIPWRNYGNGHVIFDASKGLSPEDTAINNTNPTHAWAATFPTLMGWNGLQTYGVRVDSARYADSAATAVTVTSLTRAQVLNAIAAASAGEIGTYVLAYELNVLNLPETPDRTTAGANLRQAVIPHATSAAGNFAVYNGEYSLPGTWRLMHGGGNTLGMSGGFSINGLIGIWLRIA
jgi:hypothetical protein